MNKLEQMLLDLKDTSEFMVDLAYTSLLYNNLEIAEEVMFLHTKMDEISQRIQDSIIELAQRSAEDAARVVVAIRLQTSIMSVAGAAKSIADVVLRGLGEHPVIAMSIKDADTTIAIGKVADDSFIVGQTLGDLAFSTQTGMFVIAVKRDRNYIFGPGPHHRVEAGDVMIARGPEDAIDYFKDVCEGSEKSF